MSYIQQPYPQQQQYYSQPYPQQQSKFNIMKTMKYVAIIVVIAIVIFLIYRLTQDWDEYTCKNKGLTKSFGDWRWLNPLYILQTVFNIIPLLPNVCLM